jgi:hypothetical protein
MVKFVAGKVGAKGSKVIEVEDGIIRFAPLKKPLPVSLALGKVNKSMARKIRKGLRNNGFPGLAGVRRVA